MSDPLRRSLRGLFQIASAEVLLRFAVAFFIDLTEDQHIAALGLLTLLFTFGMNWFEDNTETPAMLKAPASEGQNPIPDE